MILVDTSVWIEFFRAKPGYIDVMSGLIEERRLFAISCVFGELFQGARTKHEVKVLGEYWDNLPKVDEQDIGIEAGLLSFDGKWFAKRIGLIDLAILTAARKNKLMVWTLDKKLGSTLKSSESFQL